MPSSGSMDCGRVVELATAYIERALPPPEQERFEAHCRECPACRAYVTELRLVIGAAGQLRQAEAGCPKPDLVRAVELFRQHGFHGGQARARDVPLGIGGHTVALGDHIAYLWESELEFLATVDLLATGLARGEACVLLGHEAANRSIFSGLNALGLNTADLTEQDRLLVVSPSGDGERLLGELDARIKTAVDRGLSGVRVLGNLGWGQPGSPAEEEILELEARVTGAVARYPTIVVCTYDVGRVSGRFLLKGCFECHPSVLHRGALWRNAAYVPAERFRTDAGPSGRDGE